MNIFKQCSSRGAHDSHHNEHPTGAAASAHVGPGDNRHQHATYRQERVRRAADKLRDFKRLKNIYMYFR